MDSDDEFGCLTDKEFIELRKKQGSDKRYSIQPNPVTPN